MRFYTAITFFFFTTLFLTGCESDQKNGLLGEWYINPYHPEYQLESNNAHIILRLYPKGAFAQYGEAGYCSGTWKRNEKGSYIHLVRKTGNLPLVHEFLKVESQEGEKMTVSVFYKMPFRIADRKMTMQLYRRKNESNADPYQPELQLWRVKPTSPESETTIQKRVAQYLQFLRSMYQHGVDNKMQTGGRWYPLPLRLDAAGGGVRMAYENELTSWNQCFYDSAQAVKGYQVISGPIQSITLKSKVSNAERNLDCVEQLLEQIEK